MKRESYVYIFGFIFLISLITPVILYEAFIYINEDDNGENGETTETTEIIEEMPIYNHFPEDYILNITSVKFIKGQNESTNSLEELNLLDNNLYEVKGEWNGTHYEYEILFNFEVDLDNIWMEYYDLRYYLQIKPSINAEAVDFQANLSLNWETIHTITNTPINVNESYLNDCLGFRLFGYTSSQKIISIDRLIYFVLHNAKSLVLDQFESSAINSHSETGYATGNVISTFIYHPDFYLLNPSRYIFSSVMGFGSGQYSDILLDCNISLEKGNYLWLGNITELWGNVFIQYIGVTGVAYYYHSLYNYTTSSWNQNFSGTKSADWVGNVLMNWTSLVKNQDHSHVLDYNNTIRFKTTSHIDGITQTIVHNQFKIEIEVNGYDFEYSDYPEIADIYTVPTSPISTFETFSINANVNPKLRNCDIQNVKYYLKNTTWNSGWLDLDWEGGNVWSKDFDALDYELGNYTVWINATDTKGFSTLDSYDFSIENARPRIKFYTPDVDLEKVDQLYNYNINISVIDLESDLVFDKDVQFQMYPLGDEANPVINWTGMERQSVSEFFNYSINPINFVNGLYVIKARANDTRGYGYGEIEVNIINNAPNITIISPSETEITSTSMLIQANISNEEPINTAQYDIVQLLGNYDWKNLTYNSVSKFWEDNVDLYTYAYGDYYLVINATDDKYNSSLEIKQIQLHQFLTYVKSLHEITINRDNLNVYYNPAQTDDLTGSFDIDHHIIVKERDWEVYIPNNFTDAHEYYLIRGFTKYEPTGFDVEGIHTIWNLPDYKDSDTIYFKLQKPSLDNELIEESETEEGLDKFSFEFTLFSKHELNNINIHNTLNKYLPNAEDYIYILEYLYSGDWVEITDYDLTIGATPSFSFVWDIITANGSITFRFTAEEQLVSQNPIGIWFMIGGLIGGVAVFFYGIYANYRDLWAESKLKTILYGLLAFGIGFAGGFGIGYMLAPPTALL
jgi:hypothetical protein